MLNKLKDDILRLLKEDEEFRYAVVGLLGLQRLEEAITRLTDSHIELKNTVLRLVDIQARQEERLEEHDRKFNAILERLDKHTMILEEHTKRLEEHDKKFNEIIDELKDLRRISNEHTRILNKHTEILDEHTRILQKYDERLRNIESYIEKTSITLEEEAREVIAYRLREKDIVMSIGNLILPDIEIDIYATDTNICIIGEAKTRVSANLIEEVDKDIEKLCKKYPNYLKDKVIKVVYGMQILPNAVDEARKRGIWLITANKEYTELVIR